MLVRRASERPAGGNCYDRSGSPIVRANIGHYLRSSVFLLFELRSQGPERRRLPERLPSMPLASSHLLRVSNPALSAHFGVGLGTVANRSFNVGESTRSNKVLPSRPVAGTLSRELPGDRSLSRALAEGWPCLLRIHSDEHAFPLSCRPAPYRASPSFSDGEEDRITFPVSNALHPA